MQAWLCFYKDGHTPYENFNSTLPVDLQGWMLSPKEWLPSVWKSRPRLAVEVGCWKGRSATKIASQVRLCARLFFFQLARYNDGGGLLVAVDIWYGAIEWARNFSAAAHDSRKDLRFHNGQPHVLEQFVKNVVSQGLQHVIVPLPTTSITAARFFQTNHIIADFIHIDGSHELEDVARDIWYWWPSLARGGAMLFDDYTPGWPGVVEAVQQWGKIIGQPVMAAANKAWVFKP
eukprot:NODE_760_length_1198_cov_462.118364_g612_i0.p3 GENE.NODE_760_length_1198_cov_462.118364_g612_i0~~NODE_760_length_1198_cov_462.118364_g612_i0.p3  ORF type:complete len:232 (-),score=24.04 NODE_760_length_1198_cov_462.118364_g612_i0:114-809(-)